MRLRVELYDTAVGTVEGKSSRDFDFTPTADGIERFGANSTVLSVMIPLSRAQRRDRAPRRRNWFEELLPEGDQYDHLLAVAGLRRGDTLRFLARYGRDVAGALQIWDLDDPSEPHAPSVQAVDAHDIRRLLEDPLGAPLGNERIGGRTSLGGVQPKIVLTKTSDGWSQPLNGYPSTHIVKPRLGGELASVIYDEEYGARLARRMGLAAFGTRITAFDGLPALVIERYDREGIDRIHQEDFNQALGVSGNQKYQEYGGGATLRRVASTLQSHASARDLRQLARAVVFSVAIGNLDMHTKNIALLHPADGTVRLAPTYDAVPQAHRTDGRLALAIDGEYRHGAITRAHLERELGSWGMRHAQTVVEEALGDAAAAVSEESPLDGSHDRLHADITRFTRNLLDERTVAGDAP